jgi:putative pyruvate formate lyase activating enzyme
MTKSTASYITLKKTGVLRKRVQQAWEMLAPCTVCPHKCGADRRKNETGFCKTGVHPVIASYGPHFGEEPPLVGQHGSGTIFFSRCNIRCSYCQNYTISQESSGQSIGCMELANIMLQLQAMKCHNINLVSPTHVVPQILAAVEIAAGSGLEIPIVYNTGTYDDGKTLRLLDGVVDIYMPDAKYGVDDVALDLSGIPGYTGVMKSAIREMHRQVGDLVCEGMIAKRGMLIRHLVLPDNLAGSEIVMDFIASEISRDTYTNIMDQYRPIWKVMGETLRPRYREMKRRITHQEYQYAINCAKASGLHRGFNGLGC